MFLVPYDAWYQLKTQKGISTKSLLFANHVTLKLPTMKVDIQHKQKTTKNMP